MRMNVKLLALVAVLCFAMAFVGCSDGEDETAAYDDDDDTPGPNDDDDDTWWPDDDDDDDDTGDDDDDDDTTQPYIEFLLPEQGAVVPSTSVFVQGRFNMVDPATITLCERIDAETCNPTTDGVYFEGDTFSSSFELTPGSHTLEASGTEGKNVITDQVTFSVVEDAAHIALTLSSYQVEVNDTVTASWVVYDDDGNDVTSTVTVDLAVSPSSGVSINGSDITFGQDGFFEVTASTLFGGDTLSDSKWVRVEVGVAASISITATPSTISAGDIVSVTAEVLDGTGNPTPVNVFYSVRPNFGATLTGNGVGTDCSVELTKAGDVEIVGTVVGTSLSDTATVTVEPGDPDSLTISVSNPQVFAGDPPITPIVDIVDAYGNKIEGLDYYLETYPTNGVVIDNVAETVQFTQAGTFSVAASYPPPPSTNPMYDTVYVTVLGDSALDLEFINPPRGYYTSSSSLNVEGYAHGCTTGDYLYLNGDTTPISIRDTDCYFTHQITLQQGLNIIEGEVKHPPDTEVLAYGATGVIFGAVHANDAYIDDAFWFGLSEDGFDKIGQIVNDLIGDMNIPQMIMSMNPVFDEKVKVWGVTVASAKANVTNVSLGDLVLDFDISSLATLLTTTVTQNDIVLSFRVTGEVLGIGYSVSGDVSIDDVELLADTTIAAGTAGNFVIDFPTLSVDIHGFDLDINNFPDDLEDLFEDEISDLVEDVVSDALEDEVPALIDDLMNDLVMDYNFPISMPDGSTANANIAVLADNITTDQSGEAFTFKMQSRILFDQVSGIPPTLPGSISTPSTGLPEFGAHIYGTQNDYDFAVYVSDDILNQAFYNFFRAGGLSLDLENIANTADPLISLIGLGELDNLYPNSPINLRLRPLLPPILMFDSAKSIGADIQMADFIFNLYVEPSGSDEILILSLAVNMDIPATIDVVFPDNTLNVTLGTPVIAVDLIAEPVHNFNDSIFQQVVPALLEGVLPLLSTLLNGIQIPSFAGYDLQMLDEFLIGPGADTMSIWTALQIPQ